jgi:tetratricopeptide (TPR) repeat protein
MKNEYKNIFKNSEPLSQKEIKEYLSGNLSPQEKHRIELKIENNELNRIAFEGYAENPTAINHLPKINSGIFSTTVSKVLLFSSIFLVVAIVTYIFLHIENQPENMAISKTKNLSEIDQELLTEQISVEMEMENFVEIEPSEQITYAKAIENQVFTEDANMKIEKAETIAPGTLLNEKDSLKPEIDIINRTNSNIVYIHDLKTVDYSGVYTSGIKIFLHNMEGVPAQYGSVEDKINAKIEDFKLEFIPYREFLGSALKKFVENNYKTALKDLRIILSQYPNDLNSDFYSGLCYYNLGKWKKAIQCFTNAKNHKINVFRQEASWYLAISLIKNGEDKKAIELFFEIEKNKGFYAARASEILKKIQ